MAVDASLSLTITRNHLQKPTRRGILWFPLQRRKAETRHWRIAEQAAAAPEGSEQNNQWD
jgi:hypothetical protein